MMLNLIIEADGEPSRTVAVEDFPCRLGRHRSAEVVLSSWRVARWHAEIHRLETGFKLVDLGSIGGTWVNGERIVEYAPLDESDEIVISGYRIHALTVMHQVLSGPFVPESIRASTTDYGLTTAPAGRKHDGVPVAESHYRVPMLETTSLRSVAQSPGGSDQVSSRAARYAAGNIETDSFRPDHGLGCDVFASEQMAAEPPLVSFIEMDWRRLVHMRLLQTIDLRRKDVRQLTSDQLRSEVGTILREIIARDSNRPEGVDIEHTVAEVLDEVVGLGPLERLLKDPEVSEIMINRPDEIFVERRGRLLRSPLVFSGESAVRAVIDRIVAPVGRRIDESSPMVDARLPDGSRVNAIIPPLAVRGSVVTIRRFNRQVLEPDDLQRTGSVSAAMLRFLGLCVTYRRNVVISGGTGSGKTTLLNVLSNLIPADQRIVTIEDAAELRLRHPHLVSLEARPANSEGRGAVGIRELVRNALRMRPDRIVVGECRGGEAIDMLQAMNTGHEGSLTTVHANSPRDVIARLETMVLMAGMDLPVQAIREQIAASVHVIVQQARGKDGSRRIIEISEVTGIEAGRVQMQSLFRWEKGRFISCDAVPQFLEDLRADGIQVDWSRVTEPA
jgi:pilus assembly protein CpaF